MERESPSWTGIRGRSENYLDIFSCIFSLSFVIFFVLWWFFEVVIFPLLIWAEIYLNSSVFFVDFIYFVFFVGKILGSERSIFAVAFLSFL